MNRRLLWFAWLFISIGALRSASAADEFIDLLKRVPDSANALVVVNVQQILKSPLATREKTRDKLAALFESDGIMLPPNARNFILAAEYDFERRAPNWEVAVIQLDKDRSIEAISQSQGG